MPARRRRQRDMHRLVFQSTSTATSAPTQHVGVTTCTMHFSKVHIYVILWYTCIATVKTSAHRRRQQDMHRHVSQSTSPAGSYMYHFMMHVYRSNGMRGKWRRAGTSNGMFAGTYCNQHRPPTSGSALLFRRTYIFHVCNFVVHLHRY